MAWEVLLHDDVSAWFLDLADDDPETAALVEAAIDKLADDGPTLGRPLVDRIKGSRHHNMKELRPGSTGSSESGAVHVRLAAAGDLLVGGDKSGSWKTWYARNVPVADDGFDEHLRLTKDD